MPLLAGLLVGLASGMAEFLFKLVSDKLAIGLAAVLAFSGIVIVVLVALRVGLGTLQIYFTDPIIQNGLATVIPSNGALCLTLITATWSGCVLYSWQKKSLELLTLA